MVLHCFLIPEAKIPMGSGHSHGKELVKSKPKHQANEVFPKFWSKQLLLYPRLLVLFAEHVFFA